MAATDWIQVRVPRRVYDMLTAEMKRMLNGAEQGHYVHECPTRDLVPIWAVVERLAKYRQRQRERVRAWRERKRRVRLQAKDGVKG